MGPKKDKSFNSLSLLVSLGLMSGFVALARGGIERLVIP
jgi:hypothetical protein